jgi:hypothetical protein
MLVGHGKLGRTAGCVDKTSIFAQKIECIPILFLAPNEKEILFALRIIS